MILDLVGQFLGHGGLEPTQNKRVDEPLQLPAPVLVLAPLDGLDEAVLEAFLTAQVTGRHQIEEAFQVGQAVFHRGAGQADLDRGSHLPGGLVDFGPGR